MDPIKPSQPIELYDVKSDEFVISFPEGLEKSPLFNTTYETLIEDLVYNGIKIPESAKKNYQEKKFIFPSDDGFGKALYDFYYPNSLSGLNKNFSWRALSKK